ncbi:MAG: imidazoleglycerol-phosphate dehydratase [Gemmatimonadota bacterium]
MRRETRETRVRIRLGRADDDGDGGGGGGPAAAIDTGDRFLDHMLATFARYAGLALGVEADGDLRHHLVEDVAITLGLALREEIPERCRRYGDAAVPMDDALVHAALDAGGRFYYEGPLPSTLYDHFLRSLAENARITLHVRVLRGRDRHHVVEAAVKATGLALRQALEAGTNVFSTKGAVRVRRGDGALDEMRLGEAPPAGARTGRVDPTDRGEDDAARAAAATDEEA